MRNAVLIGVALALAGGPAFAQGSGQASELPAYVAGIGRGARAASAGDRLRDEGQCRGDRAGIGPRLLPRRYRPLEELANLPAVPAGFAIEFHHDDRGYALSLKDTRDACHLAIFTDQDRLIYEAVPRSDTGGIIPLGTR